MIKKRLEDYIRIVNWIDEETSIKTEYMKKRRAYEAWKEYWTLAKKQAKTPLETARITGIYASINNKMQEGLTWKQFKDLCIDIARRYM